MKLPKRLILVAGPTASGKSHLAQDLASALGGEILNADSQQFYQGLDIGTGKVPRDQWKVPHWLLDLRPPGEFMTAMAFVRQAEKRMAQLQSEGKTPVLVGGTGLYIRALLEGLDPLPPRDAKVRRCLQDEWKREGANRLYARLRAVDPVGADKIRPEDKSRLIRYLEIHAVSGKPPSALMKRARAETLRYKVHSYFLNPERSELRNRIARRVHDMIERGWLDEVRSLLDSGQDPRAWENKPIGYSDLAFCLDGTATLTETVKKIILRTQQYAKRQETFFRGLFKNPAYQRNGSQLTVCNSAMPSISLGNFLDS